MRVLLIGPYPPPHGGISVHVAGIRRRLRDLGVTCDVLDTGKGRLGVAFAASMLRRAAQGWTFHLHTNGHNVKSWLLAYLCGMAGRVRGNSILTLHSGMAPGYLQSASAWRRKLAAKTCALYSQVICVSSEIRDALRKVAPNAEAMEILPAFLGTANTEVLCEPGLHTWIEQHWPVFSTVLFFRPEYGFDRLVDGLAVLRRRYPKFGCLVMGSGEQHEQAEQRVHEAGLDRNVLLVGDVNHEACVALMSRSNVFLRPTLEDGDSISVREAMAMGVPVVASRVGTRPPGAILFKPGDVDEMLAMIHVAMGASKHRLPDRAGSMDRLMEIYRQVDNSEGTLCLN